MNNYTKPIRIREKPIIEQIWRPDPYIVNSKHSYFHYVSFPNIRMRITPEGLVTYTVRYVIVIRSSTHLYIFKFCRVSSVCSCFMSFCLYPHDRQECDLRISSSELMITESIKIQILNYSCLFKSICEISLALESHQVPIKNYSTRIAHHKN